MTRIGGRLRKVPIFRKAHACLPLKFLRLALDKHLDSLPPIPSPLEVVHSSHKVTDLFGGPQPSIHLGRPGGAPATIFNPALATLQQHLDHLDQVQVTRSEVQRAAEYLRRAVQFYDDEAQRQKAVEELLDGAIGDKGEWEVVLGWADNIKPDGSWWHNKFLILALELKNTLGLSGDALLQAIVDYSKIISQERVRRLIFVTLNPGRLTIVCSSKISGNSVISLSSSLVPL